MNIFKNKKFSKRQIAVGSIVAVSAAAMFGLGSSALFTSTDTAATYAATGKVEISVTDKVSVANVLPGVPRSANLTFDNSKSSAPVQMSISQVSNPSVKNLSGVDWSKFTVEIQNANGDVVYGPVAANALAAGPVNVVVGANGVWNGKMVWKLAQNAGNEFQDAAVHNATVSFTGTQIVP